VAACSSRDACGACPIASSRPATAVSDTRRRRQMPLPQ
jgi:hypothetical protein